LINGVRDNEAFIDETMLLADASTHDALAKDIPGQQRFFNASILNFLNQK
jgi:hypothetical protein